MAANILNERELTAGTIAVKGPYFYVVMTWNELIDGEIKKKTKWLPTKIPVKESGGKTKAKDLLTLVRVAFDKNNPDVSMKKLLSPGGNSESANRDEISFHATEEDKGILFSDYMLEWL